jgi:hypothetical protein
MISRSVIIAVVVLAVAASSFGQPGSAGLSFLKLGVGGRSIAMGEASAANVNDVSAMHYNPSALRTVRNPQILLMHKEWLQKTQTEYIAAAFPLGSFSVGASLNTTSIPEIEIRTVPGPPQGTFSAQNVSIGITGAYEIDTTISVGITSKYLYEKILVDEAGGLGFDLGALYYTPWDFKVGLSVANLGSMEDLRNESTKLPTTLRFGAAWSRPFEEINGILTVAGDVVSVTPEKQSHIHLGFEFAYKQLFAVRSGYMSGYDSKSVSLGAGIHYGMFTVDYGFVPFKLDLGTTHTFSLAIEL